MDIIIFFCAIKDPDAAMENGKKVNAYRKHPVSFQLVDDKKEKLIP